MLRIQRAFRFQAFKNAGAHKADVHPVIQHSSNDLVVILKNFELVPMWQWHARFNQFQSLAGVGQCARYANALALQILQRLNVITLRFADDDTAKTCDILAIVAADHGGQYVGHDAAIAHDGIVRRIGQQQIQLIAVYGRLDFWLIEHQQLNLAANLCRQVIGQRLVALLHDGLGPKRSDA